MKADLKKDGLENRQVFGAGSLKTRFPVDLHCHTTRSDGADTPQELVDHAAELGMKVIAMTDHDVRPPGEEIAGYAAEKGVVLLRGTEISCETAVEDCHIVCLGCDWADPYFERLERDVAESKLEAYRELAGRLSANGMPVLWEEVLENGGRPVPEEQVQKKMIFELMARKGYTKDWSAAKLLVKETPAFQVQRRKPDPCEVIRHVHESGGIAIMAHPYLVNEPICLAKAQHISRAEYIERLIGAGLDGMEACYPYSKTSYGGKRTDAEIEREVRDRYAHRLRLLSGGSDYHADAKKGARHIREMGECGLTWEEFRENPYLQGLIP